MRLLLIKCIDAVLGRAICSILPGSALSETASEQPKSILVIRPGGIGDAVLTIPMIQVLRSLHPSARIDVLAEKRNSAVFSWTDSINSVYCYDNYGDLLSIIRKRYDAVIDTEQWHRLSAIVARIVSVNVIVGFATNDRMRMLTHQIPYSHEDHELASFLHLLRPFARKQFEKPNGPFLDIPISTNESVRRILHPVQGFPLVAVFPGGSVKEKRWGCDQFTKLCKRLLKKEYRVVVLGGREDAPCGNLISQANTSIIDLCGKLTLAETAAVLKSSKLLISGDSGIMHLAQGVGTNVVALFGPSNTKKWTPFYGSSVALTKNLPCSPCAQFGYMSPCRKTDCLQQITEEEVYESALNVLET